MRAVVTGGSGFLGGHLMQELERRGDRPVALARPRSGAGDALEAAGHEVAREDLRRPGDGLRSLLAEADAVYHGFRDRGGLARDLRHEHDPSGTS